MTRDEILLDYEEELETSAKHHENNIRVAKERCLRRLKEQRLTKEDD